MTEIILFATVYAQSVEKSFMQGQENSRNKISFEVNITLVAITHFKNYAIVSGNEIFD